MNACVFVSGKLRAVHRGMQAGVQVRYTSNDGGSVFALARLLFSPLLYIFAPGLSPRHLVSWARAHPGANILDSMQFFSNQRFFFVSAMGQWLSSRMTTKCIDSRRTNCTESSKFSQINAPFVYAMKALVYSSQLPWSKNIFPWVQLSFDDTDSLTQVPLNEPACTVN